MTRDEVKVLFALIDANYQNAFKDMTAMQKKIAIDTWTVLYKDTPADVVTKALQCFMTTDEKGFAPKPGQLNKIILSLFSDEKQTMTELEAWDLVRLAIRDSGYHAKERWERFPPIIQKIVSPGQLRAWGLDEHGNDSVTASNFMRSYRAALAQEEIKLKLPESIRNAIKSIDTKRNMIGRETN